MRTFLLAVVMLVGCGKGGKAEEADDPAVEYVAKSATDDIPKIKAAIASPKPVDGMFKCAQMANIADLKKSAKHKALAAELEQLCTHDLQVAMIKVGVEAAEAARKAKPDETVLSECYNGEIETARKELIEYGKPDAAKDLLARFAAACPTSK